MKRAFLFGFSFFLLIGLTTALKGPITVQAIAAPILISGVQEPEEMRVEPFPTTVPTEPVRMLAEATQKFGKMDTATLLPALNRILAKFPDFSDGYTARATLLFCELGDTASALSDINNALKHVGNSLVKESAPSLLSMRAKIEYANGDYAAALDELDEAIRADLRHATQFTNSGAVKPEKTASACTWTEPDMDALVQRFPTDYRSYLLRGLYFGFFVTWDEDSLKPAIDNLNRAAELNAKSALPQLFKAELLMHRFLFRRLGWSDAEREKFDHELVREYSKALALDPNLLPALRGRASHLRQFQKAIADYDRVLSLNPQEADIYHDRALAKMQLGRDYEAISDLSTAIKLKPRELGEYHSFESRADAYMKTRQWDLAIRDLTTAISLEAGAHVFSLMSISQFRAVYPEYKAAPDEALTHKLHQTFYPNLKYEDYAKYFLSEQDKLPSFILSELYLKRSDAYLKKGNWHLASVEFHRASAIPEWVVDRWREIGSGVGGQNYIDMQTFDDARKDSIKFWVKQARGLDESAGRYSLMRFELNCGARRMRTLSFANYDASGEVTATREGGMSWQAIVPETLGEILYSGACRKS
jgi:tetratricopeptide (TPR) repeat protein